MPQKGLLVCYICGREFSSASIGIHEPQCLKKWELENLKLPRHLQRAPPQKPTIFPSLNQNGEQNDIERFNQASYESAQAQLIPCSKCGRTFQPDRLLVHEKSCKNAGNSKIPTRIQQQQVQQTNESNQFSNSANSQKSKSNTSNGPKTIICYICGREFGTKSIEIHEPQCMRKWEIENNKLPREMRRPKPKKPEFGSEPMSLEQMNEAAWQASKLQLLECENCRRKFAPDRLPVHLRSCKPKTAISSSTYHSESASSYENKIKSSQIASKEPVYVLCYICGRKYGTKSIDIHEPQCLEKWKAENSNLPKQLRRPVPIKPQGQHFFSGDSVNIEARNEAAWQASKQQLVECENCGRRFQPDRLMIHQRSCRPGNTAKKIGGGYKNDANGYEEDYQNGYESNSNGYQALKQNFQQNRYSQQKNQQQQYQTNLPVKNTQAQNNKTNNTLANYPQPEEYSQNGEIAGLVPCPNCNRKFAMDRIEKHVSACTHMKKRKVFDETKMRVRGTEAEQFLRKKKPIPEVNSKKNNWRIKHEEFIASIRYAKMAGKIQREGGNLALLAPPPPSTNPDYIQCPHCMRKFNQKAGERHIPKCKDTINKPKPPPQIRNTMQSMPMNRSMNARRF